ncbi:MAG: WD40 repeat domain-containing protein, partial [Verrucomicrobiota bacterium]
MAIFSSDGKEVATATEEGEIAVWQATDGQCVWRQRAHVKRIYSLAFDPNGTKLISASKDGTAKILDAATGRLCGEALAHGGEVNMAVFSPNGNPVLTVSDDKTARLWDAARGEPIGAARPHEHHVTCCAFSRGGKWFATGSRDGSVRVWNAEDFALLQTLRHWHGVRTVQFSEDGGRLLVACGLLGTAGEARIWNWRAAQEVFKPISTPSRLIAAKFAPGDSQFITQGADGWVRVFDAADGHAAMSLLAHQNMMRQAAFHRDGKRLVTASADGNWRLWEMPETPYDSSITQLSSSPFTPYNSKRGELLLLKSEASLKIWNVDTATSQEFALDPEDGVSVADTSPDGRWVLSSGTNGLIRVFNRQTKANPVNYQTGWRRGGFGFTSDSRKVVSFEI